MILQTLASGSKGNSIYIESGQTRILIDAGLSCKALSARLEMIGRQPEDIQAIFITHEHGDHLQGARVFAKKFAVPVYMNIPCHNAGYKKFKLHEIPEIRHFDTGGTIRFGDLSLHAVTVSHDTSDPVCFFISDGKISAGVMTDLGKVSTALSVHARKLDILLLESNHDPLLLKKNPRYPEYVKQRIRGTRGHLSNEQAAELAVELIKQGRLKHLALGHLSEENNRPELALKVFEKLFSEAGLSFPVAVAPQHEPGLKISCDI